MAAADKRHEFISGFSGSAGMFSAPCHIKSNKGLLHTQDRGPVTIHFKHSHWWKRRSWSKFVHAMLEGPT